MTPLFLLIAATCFTIRTFANEANETEPLDGKIPLVNICQKSDHPFALQCCCDSEAVNTATIANCSLFSEFESWAALSYQSNIKKLDIRGVRNSQLPVQIFHYLRRLEVLSVRNTAIKSIKGVEQCLTKSLKELYLNENSITSIEDFLNKMESLEVLDLSLNKINTFPYAYHYPLNLKVLDLSRNVIGTLNSHLFKQFKNLTRLNLSWNVLKKIYLNTFYGLDSLSFLDLSGNYLAEIDINPLNDLKKLKQLLLSDNFIENVIWSNGSDDNMDCLEEINLSGNRITQFGQVLAKMPALKKVDLRYNKIEKIENIGSKHSGKIEKLLLSGNNIKEIGHILKIMPYLKELFADQNQISNIKDPLHSEHLKIVNLSRNQLGIIFSNIFLIPSLVELDLSKNEITTIEKDAFSSLYHLQRLSLSGNKLKVLHQNWFTNISEITFLDVSNNCLEHIYLRDSKDLENLKELDISGNQLKDFTKGWPLMKNLNMLTVSKSDIETLEKGSFDNFPNLSHLYIRDNRIWAGTGGFWNIYPTVRKFHAGQSSFEHLSFLKDDLFLRTMESMEDLTIDTDYLVTGDLNCWANEQLCNANRERVDEDRSEGACSQVKNTSIYEKDFHFCSQSSKEMV